MADDLGWADTTLYGHTRLYRTPNIERLARRGMTFTRAYAASPLCSPTRSAILTGLSPARTGITSPACHLAKVVLEATAGRSAPPGNKAIQPESVTRLRADYPTLAKSLKKAGYATGHFGKWHLGREPYSALEHGFDVDVPHWPGPGPAGSYVAPWKFPDFDPDPGTPNQHIEDRMAKEAVAWIEKNKDRPFFLNYWMFSVHGPFDAKKSLIAKYRPLVRPNEPQRSPTYAAMIESMDDAVGALLDALDRLKLADNTIVIFTSDNGGNMHSDVNGVPPTSNAPLRGGKATMFEGGVRVPCVIAWPGVVKPGSRTGALVQSEDFYPTLLDALGLKPAPKQPFDGVSILPALRGREMPPRPVFQYFPHAPPVPDWLPPSVSVHEGDWKLIRIFHGGQDGAHRHLLFNLAKDLGEKQNVAGEHSDLVRELDGKIEQFLKQTGAVAPTVNPAFDPAKYRPDQIGKPRLRRRKPGPARPSEPNRKDPGTVPGLKGWKARGCKVTIEPGRAVLKADRAAAFLGIAPGKLAAGATLRVRIRGGRGEGRVEWLPKGSSAAARKSKPFRAAGKGWSQVTLAIPTRAGEAGILRLYLPAPRLGKPVELDWIELHTGDKARKWDFGA